MFMLTQLQAPPPHGCCKKINSVLAETRHRCMSGKKRNVVLIWSDLVSSQ